MKETPIKVGICKGCNNPIYNWDGDDTPQEFHFPGYDYDCSQYIKSTNNLEVKDG